MEEVLDDLRENKQYKMASKGKRFANYVIDVIAYYAFALIIGILLGILFFTSGNGDVFLEQEPSPMQSLIEILIGLLVFLSYYVTCEYFFKGKTLGKLITKTRAVTIDNERMDFGTVFKRSLCRVVPFEQFSFFASGDSGWHDQWSNTKVIEDSNWSEF